MTKRKPRANGGRIEQKTEHLAGQPAAAEHPERETSWEVSDEPTDGATRRPIWRRLRLKGSTAWIYAGIFVLLAYTGMNLVTSAVETSSLTGQVLFGTGVDTSSHELTGETTSFRVGDTLALQAFLSEGAAPDALVIRLVQTRPDGTTQTKDNSSLTGTNQIQVLTSSQLTKLGEPDVGTWKVQVLHNETVLASGTFTVNPAGG